MMVVSQFSQNVQVLFFVLEFSLSGCAGCDGGVTVVSRCAGCDGGVTVVSECAGCDVVLRVLSLSLSLSLGMCSL